jgi:hypothetical protein
MHASEIWGVKDLIARLFMTLVPQRILTVNIRLASSALKR